MKRTVIVLVFFALSTCIHEVKTLPVVQKHAPGIEEGRDLTGRHRKKKKRCRVAVASWKSARTGLRSHVGTCVAKSKWDHSKHRKYRKPSKHRKPSKPRKPSKHKKPPKPRKLSKYKKPSKYRKPSKIKKRQPSKHRKPSRHRRSKDFVYSLDLGFQGQAFVLNKRNKKVVERSILDFLTGSVDRINVNTECATITFQLDLLFNETSENEDGRRLGRVNGIGSTGIRVGVTGQCTCNRNKTPSKVASAINDNKRRRLKGGKVCRRGDLLGCLKVRLPKLFGNVTAVIAEPGPKNPCDPDLTNLAELLRCLNDNFGLNQPGLVDICTGESPSTKSPTTSQPTQSPGPSASPTQSSAPSANPSESPSISPTGAIEPIPPGPDSSASPSGSPSSASPTFSLAPTVSPGPSASPTFSLAPSASPSESPSVKPTLSLTPSASPSESPTVSPTLSLSPSSSPTGSPTTDLF